MRPNSPRARGDRPTPRTTPEAGAPGMTRPAVARPHKYHAKRTAYAGAWYDSAGEAEYARRLDLLKAAGAIHDWRRGGEWVLLDSPTGRKRDGITLRPDFEVWPAPGRLEVRDFKGVVTEVFRLKALLFKARFPDVPLLIVRADGTETRL